MVKVAQLTCTLSWRMLPKHSSAHEGWHPCLQTTLCVAKRAVLQAEMPQAVAL